jgi:hypothetical protein
MLMADRQKIVVEEAGKSTAGSKNNLKVPGFPGSVARLRPATSSEEAG